MAHNLDELIKKRRRSQKPGGVAPDGAVWWDAIIRTAGGTGRDLVANVLTILRADPAFVGKIRLDELQGAVTVRGLPWSDTGAWQEWQDVADTRMAEWCQLRGVLVKADTIAAAVAAVAAENPHHPIRERLDELEWDGTPRLDNWLTNYLGVTSTPYSRAVGRRWMISAVARIYQPGCKADAVLIFEGDQGAGKSSAAKSLAMEPPWFSDEISDLGSKDAAQDLRGKWIIEIAELSALRRSEVERTKAFISRSVDHYRPSYGRRSKDFPRQCVFIGSTNADSYLADETGNRRFWPVKVGIIRHDLLRQDAQQLWAEAAAAYHKGEQWWLDREGEDLARDEQADRVIEDAWSFRVQECASRIIGLGNDLRTCDVLSDSLNMPVAQQDQRSMKRVTAILKGAGYVKIKKGNRRLGEYYAWVPSDGTLRPVRPVSGQNDGDTGRQENLDLSIAKHDLRPVRPLRPVVIAHTSDENSSQRTLYESGVVTGRRGRRGRSSPETTPDLPEVSELTDAEFEASSAFAAAPTPSKRRVALRDWGRLHGAELVGSNEMALPEEAADDGRCRDLIAAAEQLGITTRLVPRQRR